MLAGLIAAIVLFMAGIAAEILAIVGAGGDAVPRPVRAAALVVTERAVEKHVTSIFTKLDLTPAAEDHRRVLAVLRYLQAR